MYKLQAKSVIECTPTLLFLLITVCPNRIEFCVDCCWLYVGLLFWPLQDLTWQKWFSTQSWLTMAGLMHECGKYWSFTFTRAWKPRHIDRISNHNLLEIKDELSTELFSLQSNIKEQKLFNFFSLMSLMFLSGHFELNKSTIYAVCRRSRSAESMGVPLSSSWPSMEAIMWSR